MIHNLYRIDILTVGPKNSVQAMVGYLIATNDEEVYNYLKNKPTINDHRVINSWQDKEWENPEFKDTCIYCRGEMNFDSKDYTDSYFWYGWTLTMEDLNLDDLNVLILTGVTNNIAYRL